MNDIQVIEDPAAAQASLDPIKARLLAELAQPASAASLAARLGMPRQKINYHLRALEAHGLVGVVEEKQWGGLTERRLVATAASYVVSPSASGPVAADPARSTDRLSAGYMIALAARAVREVGDLWRRAQESGKRLATLSIDTEIRFETPAARADFTREITEAVAAIAARYHQPGDKEGRTFRLVLAAYPSPGQNPRKDETCH